MAKRKKEDEEADPSIEVPKKIKSYLAKPRPSRTTRATQNPDSEKLVDEILQSPALVNKVRFFCFSPLSDSFFLRDPKSYVWLG